MSESGPAGICVERNGGFLWRDRVRGRRRPFVAFAALAIAACCVTKAAASPSQSVEILFEDNRIYVPVSVESRPPRWFIFDTGASPTIIDTDFARELGLETSGDSVVHGAGAGSTHQRQTHALHLQVGTVPLQIAQPAVADIARLLAPTSGRAPAGIIGSQFFAEHVIEIDFDARRVTVHATDADVASRYRASVPLQFNEGVPLCAVRLRLPQGRTVAATAVVDLGAKATFLVPEPFIEREHLRSAFPHVVTMGLGAGMGGDTRYAFARADFLGIGAHADEKSDPGLANPIVGMSVDGTLRSAWHEGLLGAEFLSRFKLAFDYRNKRLLMEPVSHSAAEFDMSGLFLVATPSDLHRIEVREVIGDSPAAHAGLRAGDEIVAIDEQQVDAVGLPALRLMLKSRAGRSYSLSVRRGNEESKKTLRLEQLL